MIDDLAEQQIRDADPEQLDEWIAEDRGVVSRNGLDADQYDFTSAGHPSAQHRDADWRAVSIPYSSEWWAAGVLYEEIEDANFNGSGFCAKVGNGYVWQSCKYDSADDIIARGTSNPEAIARAWLIAHVRGLLDS